MRNKEIKVRNQHSGFKVMTKLYDLLHAAKIHWDDVVDIRIDGKYVVVEVLKE